MMIMKSTKIVLMVDDELLKLAQTKEQGIIFTDVFENALAERCGVQRVWMLKGGTEKVPINIPKATVLEEPVTKVPKTARAHRNSAKDIYMTLRPLLDNEFTPREYKQALKDAGYEYTEKSWKSMPDIQLRKLLSKNLIIRLEKGKYQKVLVPLSERTNAEEEKTLKSLKAGQKAILDCIK
jgi:hypothetical protein